MIRTTTYKTFASTVVAMTAFIVLLFPSISLHTQSFVVAEAARFCTTTTPPTCGDYTDKAACERATGRTCQSETASTSKDREWWDFGGHLQDGFLWLINFLLAAFIWIVGGMLALVGAGFDEALKYSVTEFGNTFTIFEPGVNAAWAGFRDVANIIMIAMFIFVAFAVILNSETYGLKRFGVRILVVAVLINFSLFFTKAIIDVSNVTAIQFRKAILVTDDSGGQANISAAFMKHSGMAEFGYANAKDTLDNLRSGLGTPFLYTFVTILFFGSMLVVLLYGLILLVARMVILIVLMVTSAAAFAAYMIPKGERWWDKWWSELIRNALFAPLFMMFLWATLKIVSGLSGIDGANGGTIKAMVESPGSSWKPVLNMMVVVGLLYASTKIASEMSLFGAKFANQVSTKGFSAALRAVGIGALGSGLLGRLGRSTLGNAGRSIAESRRLQQAAADGNLAQRLGARMALKLGDRAGKASYDFRDSKIAKNLEKATGGLTLGKGVGSYDSYVKEEAGYLAQGAKAAASTDAPKADADITRGTPQVDQTNVKKTQEALQGLSEGIEELNTTNKAIRGSGNNAVDQTRVTQAAVQEVPAPANDNDGSRGRQNQIQGEGQKIEAVKEQADQAAKERSSSSFEDIPTAASAPSPDQTTVSQRQPASDEPAPQSGQPGGDSKNKAKDYVAQYRSKTGNFGENRRILGDPRSVSSYAKGPVNATRRIVNPSGGAGTLPNTRRRIAEQAEGIIGKSSSDKATESIKSQLDKIEKMTNKDE